MLLNEHTNRNTRIISPFFFAGRGCCCQHILTLPQEHFWMQCYTYYPARDHAAQQMRKAAAQEPGRPPPRDVEPGISGDAGSRSHHGDEPDDERELTRPRASTAPASDLLTPRRAAPPTRRASLCDSSVLKSEILVPSREVLAEESGAEDLDQSSGDGIKVEHRRDETSEQGGESTESNQLTRYLTYNFCAQEGVERLPLDSQEEGLWLDNKSSG